MKKSLLVFALFLRIVAEAFAASPSSVSDWKLEEKGARWNAVSKEFPKLKVRLQLDMGQPSLVGWKDAPENKDIGLLIYSSGVRGTKSLYRMEWVVIVDKKLGKVIGEFFWRAEPLKGGEAEEATWEWSANSVSVTHPTTGEKKTFSW